MKILAALLCLKIVVPLVFAQVRLSVHVAGSLSVFLFAYLPFWLSVCLSHVCFSNFIYFSICHLVNLSVFLFVCLSVNLSVYLSIYLSVYMTIFLSFYLFVCIFVRFLFVYLMSVFLSVCLFA